MEKRLEILSRAITLECYANGFARRALREIDAYRETPGEMIKHAVEWSFPTNTN